MFERRDSGRYWSHEPAEQNRWMTSCDYVHDSDSGRSSRLVRCGRRDGRQCWAEGKIVGGDDEQSPKSKWENLASATEESWTVTCVILVGSLHCSVTERVVMGPCCRNWLARRYRYACSVAVRMLTCVVQSRTLSSRFVPPGLCAPRPSSCARNCLKSGCSACHTPPVCTIPTREPEIPSRGVRVALLAACHGCSISRGYPDQLVHRCAFEGRWEGHESRLCMTLCL